MRKNYIVPQMETEQVNHLAALCAGSGSANMIMRKNYIVPQMETEQVNHLAALCAGSGSANMIGIGGSTSGSSITEGD